MKIVLWNTEWAKPHTPRGQIIRREILAADADLICLTEAVPGMLPEGGYMIQPGDAAPYPRKDDGQKVLLWSRTPWAETLDELPNGTTGRFVEGTTSIDGAPIRVTGVCIPWHDSHVHSGNKNRARWEDHVAFIEALQVLHAASVTPPHHIVLGDYNQPFPRFWVPAVVSQQLTDYLTAQQLHLVTSGWDAKEDALIDHVGIRGFESGKVVRIWPKEMDGVRLSDHVGVAVTVH